MESDCQILTIGCKTLNDKQSNNIIEEDNTRSILCNSAMCGSDTIYRLLFDRAAVDAITPDQNPLYPCVCEDEVSVVISDADGVEVRTQSATLIEYVRPNMVNVGPIWFVDLGSGNELGEGECITGVICQDDTIHAGNVVSCVDDETDPELASNKIRVILDSALEGADAGDAVTITYYDVDGNSLGTVSGTISLVDADLFKYEITSAEVGLGGSGGFGCSMYELQTTMKVTLT